MPDPDRLIEVGLMARKMKESVALTASVRFRALVFEKLVFGGLDSIHLACAEKAKVDVFLTTDDSLLRRAEGHSSAILIHVDNPLRWFEKVVKK